MNDPSYWITAVLISLLTFVIYPDVMIADDNPTLWIVSGQSNACGRADLPGPEGVSSAKFYDPNQAEFITAVDPLPGMESTGTGPWVAAAQTVASSGPAVNMVGFASGGQPIAYWHPGRPGHKGLFPRIEQAGQNADVFLWYQGESDTVSPEKVTGYQDELKQLVSRVRQQANNPQMLAVIVQIGRNTESGDTDYTGLRQAQRQFVLEDGNAILVPALGRSLKDSVHLDNAGYRELGHEIGRALRQVRYGQKEINWPGPILDRAYLVDESSSVMAIFNEVEQLSGCTASDFAVMDEQGTIQCSDAEEISKFIRLKFDRKIALPATLIYGYGNDPTASLVDEAGNRAPAVQVPITE